MNYRLSSFVELIASTENNFDHSVGYHDIKPFGGLNNQFILLHKYPLNNLGFLEKNINIDICLWDYKNSKIYIIDETSAWSWEQGSRLQWISDKEIIYNKINEKKVISCIYNIETKQKKKLESSLYSFSKKTNQILTINYSRIWSLWKSYGYFVPGEKNELDKKPKDDGIYLTDTSNSNKKLILSINDAVEICGLQNLKNTFFFLSFPTFSPSGDKFVSHLRFHLKSGALTTYFICTYLNKSKNIVLASEKVSHFEWINNEKIIVWSRNLPKYFQKLRLNNFLEKYIISYLKKFMNKFRSNFTLKIKSENYHLIDLDNPREITKINEKILTEDGHPQISEDGKYLVTDTYANQEGFQKLLIHDLNNNKTHYVGEFKIAEYLIKRGLKYDLHPRWNHKGDLISIDSSHDGSRQSYVINVAKLIKNINRKN